MPSSSKSTPSISSNALHFWWAAIIALVLTVVLGISTFALSILFGGPGMPPALKVMLLMSTWPVLLVQDVVPALPYLYLYFVVQFPFLWLVTFLVMRACSWLLARRKSAL